MEIIEIIEKLKTFKCIMNQCAYIYQNNDTIIIESYLNDRKEPICFIESLISPLWHDISSSTKIKLRNFMIDRYDTEEWGSMYCAKWMKEKYGYDCIRECNVVKYMVVRLNSDNRIDSRSYRYDTDIYNLFGDAESFEINYL